MDKTKSLDRRHQFFFAAIILLSCAILLRMLQLAGPGGNEFRREAEDMSLKTGHLAAIRGRIFDQHDRLLAWSERCYDLVFCFDPHTSHDTKRTMHKQLKQHFPELSVPADFWPHSRVIKYNLTADELIAADQLSSHFPDLRVELRWERRWSSPQSPPGEVRQINEMEVGISGWEAQYDHLLRGQSGTFTVMLDRHGRWIDSTFRITRPPVRGNDLYLSEKLESAP